MIETRVLMTLMSHSFPHPSVDPNLHDDDDDDDDGDDYHCYGCGYGYGYGFRYGYGYGYCYGYGYDYGWILARSSSCHSLNYSEHDEMVARTK